jgi:hypothetical protein
VYVSNAGCTVGYCTTLESFVSSGLSVACWGGLCMWRSNAICLDSSSAGAVYGFR